MSDGPLMVALVDTDRLALLTHDEIAALASAATWYANYSAREIAEEAAETHAYAVERRRSFLSLVFGLRKLGVAYAVPDELLDHARSAA